MYKYPIVISILCLFTLISCNNSRKSEIHWPTKNWKLGTPVEAGMDINVLNGLTDKITRGEYGEIDSLLVIKRDSIVFEKYFNGYDSEIEHDINSATKTIVALLVGIAIHQDKIENVDESIHTYFSQLIDNQEDWEIKEFMTIHHLLSMTSGLDWNEWELSAHDPDNDFYKLQSNDRIRTTLSRSVINVPGDYFAYNSGCYVLLGEILTQVTKVSPEDYARQFLFQPMGIESYSWSKGSDGATNTHRGLKLTPRDLAKIGMLILYRGRWEEQQLIDRTWIESMKKIQFRNDYISYGYSLYVDDFLDENQDQYSAYMALGHGDQTIFICPKFELVVVTTGRNFLDSELWISCDLIINEILPMLSAG